MSEQPAPGAATLRRDIRVWLEQAGALRPADLVEALCADMVQRWSQGERVPAEAYLWLHPCLQGDAEEAFELIYAEFVLREQRGESPALDEYLFRFPVFAERLRRQLELRRALLPDAGVVMGEPTMAQPNLPATPGNTHPAVPGYEVLEEIGRGGTGVVYRARQTSLNRVVALKVVRDGSVADAAEVRRFQREAEVIAGMQHPNIVQIFEVGRWEGNSYLALEYVAGGSLDQWLAHNPQNAPFAAAVTEMLARAIHHAHQKGVVHRDLKPANILLREKAEPLRENPKSEIRNPKQASFSDIGYRISDLEPKVTDFGLAKRLENGSGDTKTGAVMGTPCYMAPEQAAGHNQGIDARTDVWALGAILYEMLTGQPPFKGATVLATLAQVTSWDPAPPSRLQPGVPRDLNTICLKCLHKEPQKRYPSAAELADDLGCFQRGEPIRARPVGAVERALKWVRRRPTIAALLAAVVLLFVAGSTLSTTFGLLALRKAREAQENERQARDAVTKLQAALGRGLGRPLGFEAPLRPAETEVLWELTDTDEEVRFLLFTEALRHPDTATRLLRRAAVTVHATVGLSLERRRRIRELLLDKLRDRQAELEVREACVTLGAALELKDEEFVAAAADTLLERMERTTEPPALLGQVRALAGLAGRLGNREAGALSARGMRLLVVRLGEASHPAVRGILAQAMTTLAARLNEPEAAKALTAVLEALAAAKEPSSLGDLAETFAALASRLEGADADTFAEKAFQVLPDRLARVEFAAVRWKLGRALAALAGRLGPPQTAAATRRLHEALVPAAHPTIQIEVFQVTVALAGRLRPFEAAAAAAPLLPLAVDSLRPRGEEGVVVGSLAVLFVPLARWLEAPAGGAAARQVLAVLAEEPDPNSSWASGRLLAALLDRLAPPEAGRLATEAARILMDRLEQKDIPLVLPAGTLEALAPRLGADEASALVRRILKVMAVHPYADQLVGAFKALAARLPAPEAAGLTAEAAHLVANRLEKAPNNAGADRWAGIVADLTAKLAPREAEDLAVQSVNAIVARMHQRVLPDSEGSDARGLRALASRLPAPTAAKAAVTILDLMGLPNAPKADQASAVAALAGRLDSPQARPAVRQAFGLMVRAKESAPAARAAAALAARLSAAEAADLCGPVVRDLLERMRRTSDPVELADLAEAVAVLAARLNGPDASRTSFEAAQRLLEGPALNSQGPTAAVLAAALARFAEQGDGEQVVELLKHPLCVGPYREVVLKDLGRRARRSFPDVWEFVDWAKEQQPDLDLTTPPRRIPPSPEARWKPPPPHPPRKPNW